MDMGGHVDRVVELPVASSGEPMALRGAAGDLDRSGAAVVGVGVGGLNLPIGPVCPRILAARTSLMPRIWVRVVPVAATDARARCRLSVSVPESA